MFSWLIVNISTELLRCSLCSLIQKPSLLSYSFKNKAICTTGISTGVIHWKKKVGCPEKVLSKSQVATIYKRLIHGLWQQNKENRNANRVTEELGSHCPLGESQLLWKINIYITILSWGNSWVTDEHRKQYCRGLYLFVCRQHLYSEISFYPDE